MMQWSYGNKIMNELRRTRNAMRTTSNLGQDALARWKAQGDITNFPMIRYQDKWKTSVLLLLTWKTALSYASKKSH